MNEFFTHIQARQAAAIVLSSMLLLSACRPAAPPPTPMPMQAPPSPFITTAGTQFYLDGSPHTFVGVNFWQGMNLGTLENRDRLIRELDRLQSLGVRNLRIMASSEGPNSEPYRMVPALMLEPGTYDQEVFDGLDFALAEIGRRDMQAVMVLTNFWHWSGGMAQYVAWAESSRIPYPGDWSVFMDFAARFYSCKTCQDWYRDHIRTLVNRQNVYSGLAYRDDPAIFAWELANEPRRFPQSWIDDTAAYIKSLDPNHLVTTGAEGEPPWEGQDLSVVHAGPDIDYVTIHIWPQNWGWYDPAKPESYESAEKNTGDYFNTLNEKARNLGKPLVIEEFGLARDWEPVNDLYNPASTTDYRDRYFSFVFNLVYESARPGGPAAGANVWAWAGEARPGAAFTGDPPHETPGWYSIYNKDTSTIQILADFANRLAQPAP